MNYKFPKLYLTGLFTFKELFKKKGFTLVETMVATIIFALITTIILWIYTHGYFNYLTNNQKIEVQENLRIALNQISKEVRQALPLGSMDEKTKSNLALVSGENPPTKPIYVKENDKKIVFVMADGNEQKVICYYDDGHNEIQRSVNGSGNNPIASYITRLKFQYDENSNIITITVKGEKLNSGEICNRTKIYLRAL
jgi:prepilin-type N-terminal cleavage/methylation domain-containing protein